MFMETSITDWISAISNLIIAGTAVYAAFNAKKWLSGRVNDQGFDYASSLINELDSIISINSKSHQSILIAYIRIDSFMFRDNMNDIEDDLKNQIINANELLSESRRMLYELNEKIKKIEMWNLKLADGNYFNSICLLSNEYTTKCNAAFSLTLDILDNKYSNVNIRDTFNPAFDAYDTLNDTYSKFSKLKFTDIFVISN